MQAELQKRQSESEHMTIMQKYLDEERKAASLEREFRRTIRKSR